MNSIIGIGSPDGRIVAGNDTLFIDLSSRIQYRQTRIPNGNQWVVYNSPVDATLADVTGLSWGDITGSLPNQTDLQAALNAKQPLITTGATTQYLRGDLSLSNFQTDVRATVLTGLSLSDSSAIVATDTSITAYGKLQAQISAISVSGVPYTGATGDVNLGTHELIANTVNGTTVVGSSYYAAATQFLDSANNASFNSLTINLGEASIDQDGTFLTNSTIGTTGSRVLKGWFTDLTVTNAISGSITGNAATVTHATLTTALTVNTGTVTLIGNSANTSVLTIGAGAVSVSGSNTGDQTSVSGNAGTATALQNARTIGGVSFDGTANITVASATGGFTVSGGNLIVASNNIGAGTPNPSTTLEVAQGTTTDASKGLSFTANSQNWRIWINSSNNLNIRDVTNTTNKIVIGAGLAGNIILNAPSNTGNVGIHQATPTSYLHLGAGTATAGTAPIKLTSSGSGTTGLLTSPETGALELSGYGLWFTPVSTRLKVLTGNVGASDPSTSVLTAFVNYYGTGGTVALSEPNTWISVVGSDGNTYKIPAYS